jgi:simple sugar transport system ATP-binding protein
MNLSFFLDSPDVQDEPTRNLSIKEAQTVLDFIEGLKQENISVIFITHNLHHVYSVAERFLAMRKGALVDDVKKENTSIEQLTQELIK